ncbi:MAG: hypothetical protein WBD20_04620 [Pirellulaceae bacterium]
MKIAHVFLLACCFTFTVAGCGGKEETSLANDDLTAEDFAKYEAELAAVNSDEAYADVEEE